MTVKQTIQHELSYHRQQVAHYEALIAQHPYYARLWQLLLEHHQRCVETYEARVAEWQTK